METTKTETVAWEVMPGQLQDGEWVESGFEDGRDMMTAYDCLLPEYKEKATRRALTTTAGIRWCIIIKE